MKLDTLFLETLAIGVTIAAPASQAHSRSQATCSTPLQRKAWNTLSHAEKANYIQAEKCLMRTPYDAKSNPELPLPLALQVPATQMTLFDALQYVHVLSTPNVHFVGAFLPFHRLYMNAHEHLLRTACNYTGAQPYWDESLDAGAFSKSELLIADQEIGFGGDGIKKVGGTRLDPKCIHDGAFSGYMNVVGPGQKNTRHCIDRDVSDCMSSMAKKDIIDACLEKEDFAGFWHCIENGPHGAGHGGVGGEMSNLFSSPGDPLFYMHHTYLDSVWWKWQAKNSSRLTDISGSNVGLPLNFPFPPANGTNGTFPFPGNGTLPSPPGNGGAPPGFPNCTMGGFPPTFEEKRWEGTIDWHKDMSVMSEGDPGTETTLGHVLTVYGILPDTTIGEVMDTRSGDWCFEYL